MCSLPQPKPKPQLAPNAMNKRQKVETAMKKAETTPSPHEEEDQAMTTALAGMDAGVGSLMNAAASPGNVRVSQTSSQLLLLYLVLHCFTWPLQEQLPKDLPVEEDGSVKMYWFDAYEDPKNNPGCLYLFGKASDIPPSPCFRSAVSLTEAPHRFPSRIVQVSLAVAAWLCAISTAALSFCLAVDPPAMQCQCVMCTMRYD